MALSAGERLGPYEILSSIGAGRRALSGAIPLLVVIQSILPLLVKDD